MSRSSPSKSKLNFAKGTRSGSPKACPPEIIDRLDPHKLGCGYGLGHSYGCRRLLYMVTVYLVSCGYIWLYMVTFQLELHPQVPKSVRMFFKVFLEAPEFVDERNRFQ